MKPKSSTGGLCVAGLFLLTTGLSVMSCSNYPNSTSGNGVTTAEAEKFIADAEKRLLDLNVTYSNADWEKSTNITPETEERSASANKDLIAATTELAELAAKFQRAELPPETERKIKLLKLSLTLPAPKDPQESEESPKIAASMESDYGKGKYCPEGDKGGCLHPTVGRDPSHQSRSRRTEESLGRMASGITTLPKELPAICRTE